MASHMLSLYSCQMFHDKKRLHNYIPEACITLSAGQFAVNKTMLKIYFNINHVFTSIKMITNYTHAYIYIYKILIELYKI